MQEENNITVLIADDHQLFRSGLMSLLDNIEDIIVLGEARDGEELLKRYFEMKPDVIIVDISMPKLTGIEAFKEIRKTDPKCKVLFLSMYDNEDYIYYTAKIGAKGLLSKDVRKEELIHAIKTIAAGKRYFGKEWTNEKLKDLQNKYKNLADGTVEPNIHLTKREKDILDGISEGLTSSEIAEKLDVSKRTVDTLRSRLMTKLGINSLPQLIAYAIQYSSAGDIKKNL